jgi:hypothetical protein
MHLINSEMQTYIRCIKTIWNEYYRFLPDGEHDFADVQRLVWATLVIKLLQDTREEISHGEIVVLSKQPLVTVLIGSTSQEERATSWQKAARNLEGQVFLFEQFFDFRNWGDPRELQYVDCWSTSLPMVHLLVATDEVDFYYRAHQPN